MNNIYPEEDFPWSFYFNGELMPKWGACWGMARVASYLQPTKNVGHRDIYTIYCEIDHLGVVESADPDIFIYAVQEVLHILLSQREVILAALGEQSYEVYSGLVETALRMRELTAERRCAFWTSGYEADRILLVEVMRRCQLLPHSPEFTMPPHVQHLRCELQRRREEQVRRLHQLAQGRDCTRYIDSRRTSRRVRVRAKNGLMAATFAQHRRDLANRVDPNKGRN